jgi:hypothetical protein
MGNPAQTWGEPSCPLVPVEIDYVNKLGQRSILAVRPIPATLRFDEDAGWVFDARIGAAVLMFALTGIKGCQVPGKGPDDAVKAVPPATPDPPIPTFATEAEAMEWMYETLEAEEHGRDPHPDNERIGYLDDPDSMNWYRRAEANGCCGSAEYEVVIAGRRAMVGCNFGH